MTDAISRLNAALRERYVIERELGEGGMATVYLAEDLKHQRKVAIKVLKPELAAVVGAERFLAEIQTTANLQHPNILPLYDSGEADGFLFYVMPLVAGESLRDRLDVEKQLPVDEAVRITTSVATALDFAHRTGVVHRDIKPGNILFQDGQPVVGDFGIALALGAGGGARLTETGLSIGTPYYMSPEQATGDQRVGPQSDVYALGCVLYEMLVGDPPFMGSTAQAVLGKIIAGEPASPTEVRRGIPLNVDAAIRKALEKVPADRFLTAKDFSAALADSGFRYGEAVGVGGGAPRYWKRVSVGLGAASLLLAAALGWLLLGSPDSAPEVRRYRLYSPAPDPLNGRQRLTPDGSRIVVRIDTESDSTENLGAEGPQLWVRGRNDLALRPVPGTRGAGPAYAISADGSRVVFELDEDLMTVPLDGGEDPFRLATIPSYLDPHMWGEDGFIYLTSRNSGLRSVQRVRATGGDVETVPGTEGEDRWEKRPYLLPGGRALLVNTSPGGVIDESIYEIMVLDLATGAEHTVGPGINPRYAPPGHIVYQDSQHRLMAVPFDLEALETTGDPVPMADDVLGFSVTDSGDLLYNSGTEAGSVPEAVWIDRNGNEELIDWTFPSGRLPNDPTLSPDGSKVALLEMSVDSSWITVKDLRTGSETPFSASSPQARPAWSANGREIGYGTLEADSLASLWVQRVDGSGSPERLAGPFPAENNEPGYGWLSAPMVFFGSSTGLHTRVLGSDTAATTHVAGGLPHGYAVLSPNERWLAYGALVGDEPRVFVSPFPDVGAERFEISGVAAQPRWSADGQELFFVRRLSPGLFEVWAAQLAFEPAPVVTNVESLFVLQEGRTSMGSGWSYDIDHVNDRFLVVRFREDQNEGFGDVLVENFAEELRQKAGG